MLSQRTNERILNKERLHHETWGSQVDRSGHRLKTSRFVQGLRFVDQSGSYRDWDLLTSLVPRTFSPSNYNEFLQLTIHKIEAPFSNTF